MTRWISIGLTFLTVLGACSSDEPVASTTVSSRTVAVAVSEPAVAATTTIAATSAVPAGGPIVEVPGVDAHAAPVVDGAVEDDEWAAAAVEAMDDGTEVRFLQSAGFVYVGIAATEIGAANLIVAGGDVIRILHSSAALGSARYEPDLGGWVLTKDFDWCCRDVADDAARADLLAREGWQANIGYAGTAGHVEYQVLIEDGSPVALSYVLRDGTVAVWPVGLDEAARRPLYGQREESESFDVDGWATLRTRTDG